MTANAKPVRLGLAAALLLGGGLLSSALSGEPVAVRHLEGVVHGFLVLRTLDGKTLAAGDLLQSTHGDRVTSQLVFHFKDGSERKATHSVIKIEIEGVAGLVAPLLGKQPLDSHAWIVSGKLPAFVRSEGPLYLGGPAWRIELTSPIWPNAPAAKARSSPRRRRARTGYRSCRRRSEASRSCRRHAPSGPPPPARHSVQALAKLAFAAGRSLPTRWALAAKAQS